MPYCVINKKNMFKYDLNHASAIIETAFWRSAIECLTSYFMKNHACPPNRVAAYEVSYNLDHCTRDKMRTGIIIKRSITS